MLYRDTETNEIKTKCEWLREFGRELRSSFMDAYLIYGDDVFLAMLSNGLLQPVNTRET